VMKTAETVCQSPGSHLNTLFFSPPPEDIPTSIDSHPNQTGAETFLNLDPVEEPSMPAGLSFSNGIGEVHPLVSVTPFPFYSVLD
jgi:hypothetical protein